MSSLANRKSLIAKLMKNGLKLNGDGDITIYTGENSYIDPKYNFTISQYNYEKYARDGDEADIVEVNDEDGSAIFFESYAHLRMNDVEPKVATVMSAQRLGAIKYGAMYTIDKRSVFKNEINVIQDDQCIDDNTFAKYIKEFEDEGGLELANKVTDYVLLSIAMTSVVFKKTSHHYTQESDKAYDAMEQKMLGNMQIPAQRSVLYRLSLHVFGIRALADITDRLMQGKIFAESGQVVSAPPVLAYRWNSLPCGMSALSIARSILRSMEHHSWFMSFFERFGEQINALAEYEKQASINWRQFHNNATMYGAQKHEHLLMKKDLADLAPYIIGYARVFQDTQILADSKSMIQYTVNKEFIMNRFTELVKKDMKTQLEMTDIEQLFDKMEGDQMLSEQEKKKKLIRRKQYLIDYVAKRNASIKNDMIKKDITKFVQEKAKKSGIKIEDVKLNKEEQQAFEGFYGIFNDPDESQITVSNV